MATDAQIQANRQNARKSTGPRTAQGKAASSRNGLKHGLSGQTHFLVHEDASEFLSLCQTLCDRFRPADPLEERVVRHMAKALWRLDRLDSLEIGIFETHMEEIARIRKFQLYLNRDDPPRADAETSPPPDLQQTQTGLRLAFVKDCDGPNAFSKLARYEGHIERSLDRSFRRVKNLQATRHPEPRKK